MVGDHAGFQGDPGRLLGEFVSLHVVSEADRSGMTQSEAQGGGGKRWRRSWWWVEGFNFILP